MTKNIGLIACSKTKLPEAKDNPTKYFEAQNMYLGNIFRTAKQEGLKRFNCQDWFILSGKMDYNLLDKNEKIKYYDCYLGKQSVEYKKEWAKQVIEKLNNKHISLDSDENIFYIFGGRSYYEQLLPYIKHSVVFNFKSSNTISLDLPIRYNYQQRL